MICCSEVANDYSILPTNMLWFAPLLFNYRSWVILH